MPSRCRHPRQHLPHQQPGRQRAGRSCLQLPLTQRLQRNGGEGRGAGRGRLLRGGRVWLLQGAGGRSVGRKAWRLVQAAAMAGCPAAAAKATGSDWCGHTPALHYRTNSESRQAGMVTKPMQPQPTNPPSAHPPTQPTHTPGRTAAPPGSPPAHLASLLSKHVHTRV